MRFSWEESIYEHTNETHCHQFWRGLCPGLNAVITGVVLAASELGWEAAGIRDGFEGLLFPDRYPDADW